MKEETSEKEDRVESRQEGGDPLSSLSSIGANAQ